MATATPRPTCFCRSLGAVAMGCQKTQDSRAKTVQAFSYFSPNFPCGRQLTFSIFIGVAAAQPPKFWLKFRQRVFHAVAATRLLFWCRMIARWNMNGIAFLMPHARVAFSRRRVLLALDSCLLGYVLRALDLCSHTFGFFLNRTTAYGNLPLLQTLEKCALASYFSLHCLPTVIS